MLVEIHDLVLLLLLGKCHLLLMIELQQQDLEDIHLNDQLRRGDFHLIDRRGGFHVDLLVLIVHLEGIIEDLPIRIVVIVLVLLDLDVLLEILKLVFLDLLLNQIRNIDPLFQLLNR